MIKLPLEGVTCDHCDAHQHGGGAVKKYEYLDVEKVFIHSFLHVNSLLLKHFLFAAHFVNLKHIKCPNCEVFNLKSKFFKRCHET